MVALPAAVRSCPPSELQGLGPEHARAVLLLAQGHSYTVVAETLRRHERTVRRWLERPEVRAALAELRAQQARELLHRARDVQARALETLVSGLEATRTVAGAEVPDWRARRACAEALLDRGGLLSRGRASEVPAAPEAAHASTVRLSEAQEPLKAIREDARQVLTLLEHLE